MNTVEFKRVGICVCVLLLLGMTVGWGASDWANYLGPNLDLQPTLKTFNATSVTELWQAQVKTGMCSVSVKDGMVYTMGNNGTKENKDAARDIVTCLDAATGQ